MTSEVFIAKILGEDGDHTSSVHVLQNLPSVDTCFLKQTFNNLDMIQQADDAYPTNNNNMTAVDCNFVLLNDEEFADLHDYKGSWNTKKTYCYMPLNLNYFIILKMTKMFLKYF